MFTIRPWVFGIAAGGLLGGCAALHPQTSALGKAPDVARRAEGTIAQPSAPGDADYVRQARRHVQIYNTLAVMQARKGHYGAAERLIRQALVLSPNSAYLYNNLGYVELLRGNLAMARQNFEFAQELNPLDPRAKVNLRAVDARLALASRQPHVASSTSPATSHAGATLSNVGLPVPILEATSKPLPTATVPKPIAAPAEMALTTPTAGLTVLQAGPAQGSMALVQVSPNFFELRSRPDASQALAAGPEHTDAVPDAVSQRIVGLEVSNGNGVTGMAYRVARYLHEHANAPMARLTNLKPYTQPFSQIWYRPGMLAVAIAVNHDLPKLVQLVEDPRLTRGINIRVVLGHDANIAFAGLSRPALGNRQQVSLQKTAHMVVE